MATRYNYTGGIVTNGLVLNLDAAKTDSYPGTGTTWRDLSGRGNNGTLTNGPTFSGIGKQASIVFDGVDDFVSVPNNNILNSNIGTFSIWFDYTSAPGNGSVLLGKTDAFASSNGLNIFINQGSLAAQIKANSNTVTNISGHSINTNTWYNFTISYISGVSYSSYINGNPTATDSLVSFTFSTQPLRLARSVDTYWTNFGGQISTVQVYNRALSAAEVLQNFNALRGRYGI
jgi:hypothetical protein